MAAREAVGALGVDGRDERRGVAAAVVGAEVLRRVAVATAELLVADDVAHADVEGAAALGVSARCGREYPCKW